MVLLKDISLPIILIVVLLATGSSILYYVYPPLLGIIDASTGTDDTAITRVDNDLPELQFTSGSYSTTLMYAVPNNHEEEITVTITIVDDVVTETTLEYVPSNGTSEKYLGRFDDWHRPEVVGKPIADISLSRLGGASLTSRAYNRALEAIKAQAAG